MLNYFTRLGQANSLLKLAIDDIREDFELTVSVGPKSSMRFNAVFVYDT